METQLGVAHEVDDDRAPSPAWLWYVIGVLALAANLIVRWLFS
ncbi:MAG TPA: hypothetical protein QGG47_09620 [Acidobacteriota bacterium]|nr:hypothetical protein [Acidobacteriota bacterium]